MTEFLILSKLLVHLGEELLHLLRLLDLPDRLVGDHECLLQRLDGDGYLLDLDLAFLGEGQDGYAHRALGLVGVQGCPCERAKADVSHVPDLDRLFPAVVVPPEQEVEVRPGDLLERGRQGMDGDGI